MLCLLPQWSWFSDLPRKSASSGTKKEMMLISSSSHSCLPFSSSTFLISFSLRLRRKRVSICIYDVETASVFPMKYMASAASTRMMPSCTLKNLWIGIMAIARMTMTLITTSTTRGGRLALLDSHRWVKEVLWKFSIGLRNIAITR